MTPPEDPLARFRRAPVAPRVAPPDVTRETTREDEENEEPSAAGYQPFRVADRKRERLSVWPVSGRRERFTYRYLLRIVQDRREATEVILIFTFAVVIIRGRNLQGIADAIDRERCVFVQQFDYARWGEPVAKGEPVVASIEVVAEKPPAQVMAEVERERAKAG